MRTSISLDDLDWQNLESISKKLKFSSRNELVQKLIKNFLNTGEDYQKTSLLEISTKERLEKEKLKKIEFENAKLAEIKKRKLEAETKIKEYHAKHVDVLGSHPSSKAHNAMKHHVTPKLNGFNEYVQKKYKIEYFPNDELCFKALCQICESLFESKDKQEVTDDVCWHIEEIHKQRPEIVVSTN